MSYIIVLSEHYNKITNILSAYKYSTLGQTVKESSEVMAVVDMLHISEMFYVLFQ